jgi:hypothetical protein
MPNDVARGGLSAGWSALWRGCAARLAQDSLPTLATDIVFQGLRGLAHSFGVVAVTCY